MRYVIQRSDGWFVALPGEKSYVRSLLKARIFSSREKAEKFGVCGNERIICVNDLLRVWN